MFGTILQRMIFSELAKVFLLALVGITGIMVMAGIVAEATQQGLGPSQVLAAIPLLVPSFLPYTVPATTLFATCVVYGRLAADNEILAIKAAGVHLRLIVGPAILLGLLMSGVTLGLYYKLIPYTHHLLRSSFLNDAEDFIYSVLRKDRSLKRYDLPYCIFVRGVQGRRLQDALFKRKDKDPTKGYDVVAWADSADIHVDMAQRTVFVHMIRGEVLAPDGTDGHFQEKTWPVELTSEVGGGRKLSPRGMGMRDLIAKIQQVGADIAAKNQEIDAQTALRAVPNKPPNLDQHVHNLENGRQQRYFEKWNLETEFNMRPTLSFGCLCFVLVGCPVGIWFSKSDYLSAFITCFLPIVFLYYPLLLCSTNFAKQGRAPAALVLWGANAIMVVIAMFLFRRLLKH